MRGLAALSVAIAHSDSSIGNNAVLHFARWHRFEMPGTPGVEFFFVLSGFVMALMHAGEIGRGGHIGRFLWRRVCRIYPIYLIALGYLAWQFWGAPSVSLHALIAWASLLPIRSDNLIVVAWTLRQEVTFYLVFALCLLPRIGWVGPRRVEAGTVGVGLLGWSAAVPGVSGLVTNAVFNPFTFEFFAGLAGGRTLPPRAGETRSSVRPRRRRVGAAHRPHVAVDGWGEEYGPVHARIVYGAGLCRHPARRGDAGTRGRAALPRRRRVARGGGGRSLLSDLREPPDYHRLGR